jgi:hypothetical protein
MNCTVSSRLVVAWSLILGAALSGASAFAKDRDWVSATVTGVAEVKSQRHGAVQYTIQIEGSEYTLEHQSQALISAPPMALVKAGEVIRVAVEKEYVRMKLPSGERRLRIVRRQL